MRYYKATFLTKGEKENIIFKALNKSEAIIESKKLHKGVLIDLEEIPMPFDERIKVFKDIFTNRILRKKLNYPTYISSLRQLSVLVKAGISLKDSLEDISNNTPDALIKEIFSKAAEAVDSGKTLSDVFAEYENYIGGMSVAMIQLGEQTGDLVNSLESLAKIYEEMYENKRKLIKALRYPMITIFAIIGAFTFLVLVIVPKFKSIFESLHAQLPLPTVMLLDAEYILSHYGFFVLAGLILSVITLIYLYKTSQQVKYKVDKILLRVYLIKDLIEYATITRMLSTLASLIKSGIPLVDALKIVEGIVDNAVIKEKVKNIIKGINQGRSLAEMVQENNLVNYVALRMISAGEQTGELEGMLESASDYYSDKFQDIIDNMQAAIEPIMMVVIGGMVLWLALGIFMPMWNLASAAKGG